MPSIIKMYKFKHKTLCDFNLCIVERNDDTRIDVFCYDDYLFTVFKDGFGICRFENFSNYELKRMENLQVEIYDICGLLKAINENFQILTNADLRDYICSFDTVSDCVTYISSFKPDFFKI